MKQYIDFCATMQGELTAKLKLASQLKRLWGTEIVDGVEVYKKKFVIWPGTETENVRKMLKLFGIKYEDINSQSKQGITQLYLYFNPKKLDTTSISKEALATYIETNVAINEWREFTVTYYDPKYPMKFTAMSKAELQAFVESNIATVATDGIANAYDSEATNIDDVIGLYVLAENGVDFEKQLIDVVRIPIPGIVSKEGVTSVYVSGVKVRYRYRRFGHLDDASPIVESIYSDMQNAASDIEATKRVIKVRESLNDDSAGNVDTLWYNKQIRTASSKLLKKFDYANLIFGTLDVGFKKKSSSGWLNVLAVIIIIAVTYITWNPEAGLAAGAAVTSTSVLTTIAITAGAVTLALTVYSMILTKFGETGSAEYVGRWIKVTSFVSMAAGIAAVLTSLTQRAGQLAIEEGAKTATVGSAEAAAMNGVTVSANNVVVEVSLGNIYDAGVGMLTDSFSSATTWLNKLSTASKVINPIMEWRTRNQQKELTSMSDECKKQQELLMEEYDKNLHIGLEDIKMYTKPLTVANIQYEVDYLYEPTKFNVQRGSFARSGMNIIS